MTLTRIAYVIDFYVTEPVTDPVPNFTGRTNIVFIYLMAEKKKPVEF